MPLNPGTRLGPYEVLSPAGAGGMGEVYRARDTRLDRTVAIKVLPSEVSASPELRERFEREARTVAALNHPHICTLHDVGREGEMDFLVMEFLEGESLADRLKKGPLPLDEALQYAQEIADALDKAHRAGIVHRDLKPGNVMLTKSGAVRQRPQQAKLLDFGLAKTGGSGTGAAGVMAGAAAMASAIARVSMMPTEATPLTLQGAILGTLQYMAPEQLEGRDADARTDIFAFGSVLYEMVTGRRAFEGKSQVGLMAAIMDQDPPPIRALQPVTPPLLEHLVKTCLAKSPDARWQHAGDLLIQLRLIVEQSAEPAPAPSDRPARRRRSAYAGWAAAGILGVASIALAGLLVFQRDAPSPARVSFQIETETAPSPLQIAISPDGTRVATMQSGETTINVLWVRALENLVGQTLPRAENAQFPFWSPDGQFIGFFADGKLKKIDLLGTPPQILCDTPGGAGGTWNRDNIIVFAPTSTGPLFHVSAAGGIPVQVTELDTSQSELAHRHPFFLPDGDHFLYSAISGKADQSAIYVGSLISRERKRLVASTLKAVFAPPDHLLFIRDNNTLLAQRFDTANLELSGDPFPAVAEDVGTNLGNGAAGFTVSNNGILAYRSGGVTQRTLAWYDSAGKPLGTIGQSSPYTTLAISPDAQRVAAGRQEGRASDIWMFDSPRGTSSRFTFDASNDVAPIWSPDGAHIVFASSRAGSDDLYRKSASGVGAEELLLKSAQAKLPDDWSRDGRSILFRSLDPKTAWDVWVLPLEGDRTPRPVVQTRFNELQGSFSPDGRWIAYVSDESGRSEVYVQSFPPSGSKWQISTGGGAQPRWRGDGKVLFFVSTNYQVMAVDITAAQEGVLTAGVPRRLFVATFASFTSERNAWDVTPDGQRFLINQAGYLNQGPTPITVVVNWLSGPER